MLKRPSKNQQPAKKSNLLTGKRKRTTRKEVDLAIGERIASTKTFYSFSKLPTELKIEVWKYIVKEWLHTTLASNDLPRDIGLKASCRSPLFSACQLSRDVAFDVLRVYDRDVEVWEHVWKWWSEPILVRQRSVFLLGRRHRLRREKGDEGFKVEMRMRDFRPTRRSVRARAMGRVDCGVEGMFQRLDEECEG